MVDKNKGMKKSEIITACLILLKMTRFFLMDYHEAVNYNDIKVSVGDWGMEITARQSIESILKLTKVDNNQGTYEGIDILGNSRSWRNALFYKLPERCQKTLDDSLEVINNKLYEKS